MSSNMAQITKLISSKAELQTQFQFIFKSYVMWYHALLPSQSITLFQIFLGNGDIQGEFLHGD